VENKKNYRPRLPLGLKNQYERLFKTIDKVYGGVDNILSIIESKKEETNEHSIKNCEKQETSRGFEASVTTSQKLTLEEFVALHEIDLTKVNVEYFNHKSWDVGAKNKEGEIITKKLFSTSGKFKKIHNEIDFKKIKQEFLSDLENKTSYVPKFKPTILEKQLDNLLVVCLYDLHLNKQNYLKNEGKKDVMQLINNTINLANCVGMEKVLLVVGGDFFNIDNIQKTTFGNTPQDVEVSYENMIREGRKYFIDIVTSIVNKGFSVDVVFIPGNHDKTTLFTFGEMIDIWYRNDENVNVINNELTRKYYTWGKCLLGLTHGDKATKNLSKLMALEAKELWGAAEYYEWYIGHTHGQKEIKEEYGIVVRTVSSISGADRWHYENGYIGNRQCLESFVWNKTKGKLITIEK
jgi:Icc-related predicted phosphoesterase